MDNRCAKRLLFCWMLLHCDIVLVCVAHLIMALAERGKLDYVQSDCLVIDSSLKDCGVHHPRGGPEEECCQLQWPIQYVQYADDKQGTISLNACYLRSRTYMKDQLLSQLRKYEIGQIYRCYHSPANRLTKVQWEKPSREKYTKFMKSGSILLILSISLALPTGCFVAIVLYDFRCRCQNLQLCIGSRIPTVTVRNAVSGGEQHAVLIPAETHTTPMEEEENISLNSLPPAYTPLSDCVENESIPSSPPPPYGSIEV